MTWSGWFLALTKSDYRAKQTDEQTNKCNEFKW